MLVDAAFHATADAGSTPAASTFQHGCAEPGLCDPAEALTEVAEEYRSAQFRIPGRR